MFYGKRQDGMLLSVGNFYINNLQKGTILILLEADKVNNNYINNYWFSYKDYLYLAYGFTDFCCECLEGKYEYIVLVKISGKLQISMI